MNKRKSIKSGYILYSPAVWPEEEFQVVVTCIYGQQLNKADEQLWCMEWLEKGMCCVEWLEKGVWINEKSIESGYISYSPAVWPEEKEFKL